MLASSSNSTWCATSGLLFKQAAAQQKICQECLLLHYCRRRTDAANQVPRLGAARAYVHACGRKPSRDHRGDGEVLSHLACASHEGGQRAHALRLPDRRAGPVRRPEACQAADEIVLGDVVRATEPDFALVECFATGNQCVITGCCRLPRVLDEALDAFLGVRDRHTLESLTLRPTDFRKVFAIERRAGH